MCRYEASDIDIAKKRTEGDCWAMKACMRVADEQEKAVQWNDEKIDVYNIIMIIL